MTRTVIEQKDWWARWLPNVDRAVGLDALYSGILLLTLLALRALILRAITRNPRLSMEVKRRWMGTLRNVVALTFIVGLIFIWGHELRTFAVSLIAVAVALVLATKELILCLSGAALRAGGSAYDIGHRIQISGHRGVVLDQNLFATTLLEIGPGASSHIFTGRSVVFPNSLLFTTPLINETFMKDYVFHLITVPLSKSDDWKAAEKALLDAAHIECAPFLEEARKHMRQLEAKNLLEAPTIEPRVILQLPEPDRITLVLRVPTPGMARSRVEQAVLRRFLAADTYREDRLQPLPLP